MEENKDNPSQLNRFQVDGMHNLNIVEWKKKRKLQIDQFDLLRPKYKCRAGGFSSENDLMMDKNLALEREHNHMVKSGPDAALVEDRSEPESAKDSNSFIEDSDTAMSVNEETKQEADCGNTYLYVNRISCSEEGAFVDSKYHPFYDIQTLENHEENLLEFRSISSHECSESTKDGNEHSVDKEFEDFLFSTGVNPNVYVLSSGRWNVNQEAESNSKPPTIDQEFEEYFSMLML